MQTIDKAINDSEVILFSCDRNGTITLQEGGGLKKHGIHNGQHVGLNAFETFTDLPDFLDALKSALDGHRTQAVYKWGAEFCETNLTPLDFGGAIGVCTTQTSRVLREQQLTIEKEILAREEGKRDFLANISHELRSPLASIISLIGLMKENMINDLTLLSNFDIIGKTANQLLSLVNNILDYAKITKNKMEIESIPYRVDILVNDLVFLLQCEFLSKNITFNSNITEDLKQKQILGDPTRVRQILVNFLSNAVKFTPYGGLVDLTATIVNENLSFTVKDTGIGIKDTTPLFKEFQQENATTSRIYGGSGLGLSICKKLTEFMGGSIGCNSVYGEGSVFWFTIPCTFFKEKQIVGAHVKSEVSVKTPRIMIAEKTVTMQIYMIKLLNKLGYINVTICDNGQKALNDIEMSEPYDFVFLDYMMPKLNGIELLRRIKHRTQNSILIFMSDDDATFTSQELKDEGFHESIKKPVGILDLKHILEKYSENVL